MSKLSKINVTQCRGRGSSQGITRQHTTLSFLFNIQFCLCDTQDIEMMNDKAMFQKTTTKDIKIQWNKNDLLLHFSEVKSPILSDFSVLLKLFGLKEMIHLL